MNTPRIKVPTLLDGGWDSALICTYGADLEFYERDLLRQIDRAKNRIIFADARQVARKLSNPDVRSGLRHINRTYVLAPITTAGAAHVKLILLLNEDRGLLAIGSGNLGMRGYADQGECFTTYKWSADEPEHLPAFVAAKGFIDQLNARGLIDQLVRPRVQQAWQDAPWLFAPAGGGEAVVRHNLHQPLLDQLIDEIGGRPVKDLVVHAPFYDHKCHALAELLARTAPARLQLLLQKGITSVDPTRLGHVLEAFSGSVDIRSVEAEVTGTFLHAKFVIARLRDGAVCLQGSPNISTPALVKTQANGNIEMANLLTGRRDAFDHLVDHLVVSRRPVDLDALGLALAEDDDESTGPEPTQVTEFALKGHRLTGVFARNIDTPPEVWIGDELVEGVTWDLEPGPGGATRFTATLSDAALALVHHVAAVVFTFGEDDTSSPAFPYHLNALIALSSGQGRTDLLKQAGDFDLDDEELEQLLVQLDEVLVVDGHSLWRMLKRPAPVLPADGDAPVLAYEDLDWDTIQSHPKLAQYRTWEQRGGGVDPTGLGILLNSIAERFRVDVDRIRGGASLAATPQDDESIDLGLGHEAAADDEEAAEQAELERERRRMSARGRARRQFTSFVKRFVAGITDEEFVRLVGPSVIVPSYVIFNHLCWKLLQNELADPMFVVHSQEALWGFFWGTDDSVGYLDLLSEAEQIAALDILGRHHAEAVLLCSMVQAYSCTWYDGSDDDVAMVRDAWRQVLRHPLWQPTSGAVKDAATLVQALFPSAEEMVDELDGLASFQKGSASVELLAREAQPAARSGQADRGPRISWTPRRAGRDDPRHRPSRNPPLAQTGATHPSDVADGRTRDRGRLPPGGGPPGQRHRLRRLRGRGLRVRRSGRGGHRRPATASHRAPSVAGRDRRAPPSRWLIRRLSGDRLPQRSPRSNRRRGTTMSDGLDAWASRSISAR
ncbi:hypothetical protein ACE2AJ_09785 [Aquihabitans daechungensis]|uniref:hypothetical protein n=1 Tax=Aquihabitans daechungensis TaxID=1052257 RepID=UPI003BA2D3FB